MNRLLRCQDWILGKGEECRRVLLSIIVGPGGLDREMFSRALGNAGEKGLYAFVWVGPDLLVDNRPLKLKGKKANGEHEELDVVWRLADFPAECHRAGATRFPLYVGRTTTIIKRIDQHLHLTKGDWRENAFVHRNGRRQEIPFAEGYLHKHSTTCQFRSGMQHLYPEMTREEFISVLSNIELCYLPIPDMEDDAGRSVQDRFYLEDLAIGYFRPWFNVDSER